MDELEDDHSLLANASRASFGNLRAEFLGASATVGPRSACAAFTVNSGNGCAGGTGVASACWICRMLLTRWSSTVLSILLEGANAFDPSISSSVPRKLTAGRLTSAK